MSNINAAILWSQLENLDEISADIQTSLEEVKALYPEAILEDHLHTEFEMYNLSENDPATVRVKYALKKLGLKPTMKPSGGGTDGNVFRLNGISSVVVGMADNGMHTTREFVTIPDLVDAAHLCETLLRV